MMNPAPSTPPRRLRHETLVINLVLLALIAIFLSGALRPGRVLAAADQVFTNPLFEPVRPDGWVRQHNPMLFDHAYLLGPWRHVTWPAMREGRLPLWNSMSYCGSPLAGSAQAMVFSPLNWLTALMPFTWGFLFLASARLWIAGLGTYLLARHYGLQWQGALLAAIAFMFCGFQVVWLMFPMSGVAAWLPLMILAADKALLAPKFAGAARPIVLLTLVTALHWTGGHPETSVDLTVTLGVYAVARLFFIKAGARSGLIKGGWLLLSVLLGMMLAAPAIWAFIEWLPLSAEFQSRSIDFPFRWIARSIPRRLLTLPLLIVPDFYGNPTWPYEWTGRWIPGYYPESALYIGIIPLVCAMGALVGGLRRMPGWLRIWLIVGTISFGRAFQWPVFDWINQLPVLGWAHPTRLRFVFCFALCMTGGYGFELFLGEIAGRKGVRGRWGFIAAICCGVGMLLAFFCPVGIWKIYLPPALAGVFAILLFWLGRRAVSATLMGAILLIIAAGDMISFGSGYNTVVRRRDYYPENPTITPMQADAGLFRATALDGTLLPDLQLPLGFSDIRGMDFQTAWYGRYIALSGRIIEWLNHAIVLRDVDSPLLRVLNLKYVIRRAEAGGVELETIERPQPRSFMVSESLHAASDDEAAAKLAADPEYVFRGVILVKSGLPEDLRGGQSKVDCLQYGPESSVWRVGTEHPGYLVTTDAFYPGWRATIDGEPAPIERANLAFRAVFVPAGEHLVTYQYAPEWLRNGLMLAMAASIALLLIFLTPFASREKAQTETS